MVGLKLGVLFLQRNLVNLHMSEHNAKKLAKIRRKITQKKVRKTTVSKKKPSSKTKKKK